MTLQRIEILLEGNWGTIKRVMEEIDELQRIFGKVLTFEVDYKKD